MWSKNVHFLSMLIAKICQRRGVGGQEKPKSCQRSLWRASINLMFSNLKFNCQVKIWQFSPSQKYYMTHNNTIRHLSCRPRSSHDLINPKIWIFTFFLGIKLFQKQLNFINNERATRIWSNLQRKLEDCLKISSHNKTRFN